MCTDTARAPLAPPVHAYHRPRQQRRRNERSSFTYLHAATVRLRRASPVPGATASSSSRLQDTPWPPRARSSLPEQVAAPGQDLEWTLRGQAAPHGRSAAPLLLPANRASSSSAQEGHPPRTSLAQAAAQGPPDTGASRRLLFGRSIAAIDRRPGRRPGAWDPASLGLTENHPNGINYSPSLDEEDFVPPPPAARR